MEIGGRRHRWEGTGNSRNRDKPSRGVKGRNCQINSKHVSVRDVRRRWLTRLKIESWQDGGSPVDDSLVHHRVETPMRHYDTPYIRALAIIKRSKKKKFVSAAFPQLWYSKIVARYLKRCLRHDRTYWGLRCQKYLNKYRADKSWFHFLHGKKHLTPNTYERQRLFVFVFRMTRHDWVNLSIWVPAYSPTSRLIVS